MMTAWNETSGVSIHAELVGKEWIKNGNKFTVFSFLKGDSSAFLNRTKEEG